MSPNSVGQVGNAGRFVHYNFETKFFFPVALCSGSIIANEAYPRHDYC